MAVYLNTKRQLENYKELYRKKYVLLDQEGLVNLVL